MLYMVPDTFPIVRLDRDTHVSYASRCWDTRVLDSCWCDSLLSLLVIKRNTIPGSSQLMWLWIAFQPIAPQCLLQKIIMLVYGTLVDVPCTRQSFGISQNYLWMPVLKALTPATRHLYSIMPLAGHWLCNGIYSISCPATPKLCTFLPLALSQYFYCVGSSLRHPIPVEPFVHTYSHLTWYHFFNSMTHLLFRPQLHLLSAIGIWSRHTNITICAPRLTPGNPTLAN